MPWQPCTRWIPNDDLDIVNYLIVVAAFAMLIIFMKLFIGIPYGYVYRPLFIGIPYVCRTYVDISSDQGNLYTHVANLKVSSIFIYRRTYRSLCK
jgi:hypothetical protein